MARGRQKAQKNGKTGKPGKQSQKKVRYVVAGLGYISQIAVLPAFKHAAENSELVALISSDPKKLDTLGKKYKVPNLFRSDQYEECLHSGLVDAVYLGIPNSAHCRYTIAAARAGVHVLCEKPMAVTEQECEEMIDECERANVQLMIAYRLHFEKSNLAAIETVKSGKLGDIRLFSSVFSYPITDDGNIRLSYKMGGGPLFDLGIYCINAARYLFQSEPTEVTAFVTDPGGDKFDEVEEATSVLMRFPGNRLAQFTCSFGGADTSVFEIIGSKGTLRAEPAYDFAHPIEHTITIDGKKSRETFPKSDQFAPELTYFSECIQKRQTPETSGIEGLIDVYLMNAIYRSVAEGRAIPIADVRKRERPSIRLVKTYPPVSEPRLINAASPSK